MALSLKARKRWALIILLLGVPAYIVAVVNILSLLDRPPFWLELIIYVGLGVVWIVPFKFIFKGIGQADPDAEDEE